MCKNMTRTTATKLLLLVIFIFIICLPDFFSLYRVSKFNFICLPCNPHKRMKNRENGRSADAEVRRKTSCDPLHIPWQEACDESDADSSQTQDDTGSEDPRRLFYRCEAQGSGTELHSNSSGSAKIHIEMLLKLQLGDANFLNLTLYGHTNSSSLQLHPHEEETDDGGHGVASYCCHQVSLTSERSNHIVCLVRLSNHTFSTAAVNKNLRQTQDEWSGMFRILWLVLLCVVLLTLTLALIRQVKRSGHCKKGHPVDHGVNGQQLKGRNLHSYEPRLTWSGLSPIEEVEVIDDAETVPEGHVDYSYVTANLHHRPTLTLPQRGAELMDRTQL
ncbi:uncharacterized protein LOC130920945 isoform X2 [Corythoichthys intestinalis]|uniref:uncharacterized protein LOC130920945 isoform X2 n=1 Tax=Corythoichthys intestinalis TaxID=161448 RepID=UPI0025A5AAD7|nr:uncharacterized protein LOC130920945 isoform X2 [Corythoichthys intestinalis]